MFGIGRLISFFKKPKGNLSLLDTSVLDPSGIVDTNFSKFYSRITLDLKQTLAFADFLQRVVYKDLYEQDQDIVWSLRRNYIELIDKLWMPIETVPEGVKDLDLLYADGSRCSGKCITIGACSSSGQNYYVPFSLSIEQAMESIRIGDLPTHWRKRSYRLKDCKSFEGLEGVKDEIL